MEGEVGGSEGVEEGETEGEEIRYKYKHDEDPFPVSSRIFQRDDVIMMSYFQERLCNNDVTFSR